jgi:hypothetical protein
MFDIRMGSIRAAEEGAWLEGVEAQAATASEAKRAASLIGRLPLFPD